MKKDTNIQETDDELVKRLRGLNAKKSLRKVQTDNFPFASMGTLSRIAKGKAPTRKRLRDEFRLFDMVRVKACPNCGKGHTRKCYPKKDLVKLKSNWDALRTALIGKTDVATILAYVKTLRKLEDEERQEET